jgi:hypothetical protein
MMLSTGLLGALGYKQSRFYCSVQGAKVSRANVASTFTADSALSFFSVSKP